MRIPVVDKARIIARAKGNHADGAIDEKSPFIQMIRNKGKDRATMPSPAKRQISSSLLWFVDGFFDESDQFVRGKEGIEVVCQRSFVRYFAEKDFVIGAK